MATKDKYTRGSTGYSKADEKDAKRYAELTRLQAQDALDRKNRGEKNIIMSENEVGARKRVSEANYKENLKTEEGRDVNARNMAFTQKEVNQIFKENSRGQYQHEKEAGDPNATNLSFEEWKKL